VNKLWDDVPHGAQEQIPLETFVEISPTILGEVYLWLALRNEASAILGANVYDIRSQSLDCNAYLSAASERGTPIVLQGSLNALGQRETDEDGTEVRGYLKPSSGALDLSKAVLTAARDKILLEGAMLPLFGIGLDHVDIRQDRPKGRAKRFLHDAVNNGSVTHFVLDGSALFDAKDRSSDEMEAAFAKIADYATDLLDEQESFYIFDHEVCAGELNYVGSDSSTFIPSGDEMFAFAKIYREAARSRGVGAINVRPTLIIGNLGTTHHSFDTGDITVEAAVDWGSRIKSFNFVSAVLHGTTNSHPDILARATKGCYKVNVAGDFLRTLVQGLPNTLRDEVESGPAEAKYMLPEIRDRMDLMPVSESKQLLQSLKAHARSIIDTIRSPRLTPIDVNYFRYMFYRYEPNHVDSIVDALLSWKANKPKVSVQDRSDPEMAYAFSASLIEVPFGPSFEEIAKILWAEGVRNFHIDAGDGRFISREINGLEKAKYLRKTFAGVTLHAHLMMEEPHVSQSPGKSPLEEYIDAGCSGIAIHERAFANKREFHHAIHLMQSRDVRAGVIVETSQHINDQFWQMLCDAGIDWCVVMGVPIGYGGQIFDQSTINRISSLNWYARRDGRPFLIEVDGGLTLESLRLCCNAGGQIFAGWSIIRGSNNEEIRMKYRAVRDILQKRSY
jgi:ribulose-phosphate 3-epimerase